MVQQKSWDLSTRLLHFGLAVTVTIQLFVSLFMTPPGTNDAQNAVTRAGFVVHRWVGMAALVIVLAHWLWTIFAGGRAGIAHLFPWGRNGRREIANDIRALMSRRLVEGGPRGGIAGLVHGLGLLAATGMVITGGVLFVLWPESGKPGALADNLGDLHSLISNFVWAYWYGHVALAVIHQFKGHDTLRRMFWFD